LIGDACKNWSRPEQRARLARNFEHARMLSASKQCVDRYKSAASGSMESDLFTVAHAFFQLQEKRRIADYDLSKSLERTDADLDIFLARSAFDGWKRIQAEQFAQDYLFSLLFKDKQ
jgi:hypothetical protein